MELCAPVHLMPNVSWHFHPPSPPQPLFQHFPRFWRERASTSRAKPNTKLPIFIVSTVIARISLPVSRVMFASAACVAILARRPLLPVYARGQVSGNRRRLVFIFQHGQDVQTGEQPISFLWKIHRASIYSRIFSGERVDVNRSDFVCHGCPPSCPTEIPAGTRHPSWREEILS